MKDINGLEISLGDIVTINNVGKAKIIMYESELCTEDIATGEEDVSICGLSKNWNYKIIERAASAEPQPAIIQQTNEGATLNG